MKRRLVLIATCAFALLSLPTLTFGQTDLETRAAEISEALVNGHRAWRTILSSTGVVIQAKEVERHGASVKYFLTVSGLPADGLFTVVSWPVGQEKPATIMEGISIGKDGTLICAGRTQEQCGDPSKKDEPVDFVFEPAKGEPYRLAVLSGEHRAAIIIVPDPITAAEDKGCRLSVERLLPEFELAYFTGSGFAANCEATFDSESYGEKHTIRAKADNEGHFDFAVLPGVSGHPKGTTAVKGVGMKMLAIPSV